MKLLYVVDTWPHLTETFVLREILAASKRHDVRVLALEEGTGQVQPEAWALTDRVRFLPRVLARKPAEFATRHPIPFARASLAAARTREESGLERFSKLLSKAEILREWGVERIHAHFARWATAAAEVLSAATGAPFGFTAHAYDVFESPLRLADKARRAAWCVTCSAAARREIQRTCGPVTAARFRVIRHGVDLSHFCPSYGTRPPGTFRLLHVGSLIPLKRHDVLIDALAKLDADRVPFEARFIGGGPEEAAIRRQVEQRGLSSVIRVEGARPMEEVRAAMRGWADVLAILSTREGLPNVVGEAMACGIPVVGTQVGGIPEMLKDGVTGFFVPLGDAAATAAVLERLAGDAGLRARLGLAARAHAEAVFDANRNLGELFARIEAGDGG